MGKKKMDTLSWVATILVLIGGINWGLIGFFKFNIVEALFGTWAMGIRIVYGIVGVATLIAVYRLFSK